MSDWTWIEEFDHGSDWTLAAGLTHASRTVAGESLLSCWRVADGWVMLGNLAYGGDNDGKLSLIPRIIGRWKCGTERPHAIGWAQVGLGSWWGKCLPSLRSLAGLRGWPATLELRHGPDSYGRQQWGILRNGGTLTQPCRVNEEGLRVVKFFRYWGRLMC